MTIGFAFMFLLVPNTMCVYRMKTYAKGRLLLFVSKFYFVSFFLFVNNVYGYIIVWTLHPIGARPF